MPTYETVSFEAWQTYSDYSSRYNSSIFGGKFDLWGTDEGVLTPTFIKDIQNAVKLTFDVSDTGAIDIDYMMVEIFYIANPARDLTKAPTRPIKNLTTSCIASSGGKNYLLLAGKNGILYRAEIDYKNRVLPTNLEDFDVINLPTNETIWKLQVGHAASGKTVFATGGNGVFLTSDDGGETWLLESLSLNGSDLYGMDISSVLARPVCVGSKDEALTRLMLRRFSRKKILPGAQPY